MTRIADPIEPAFEPDKRPKKCQDCKRALPVALVAEKWRCWNCTHEFYEPSLFKDRRAKQDA